MSYDGFECHRVSWAVALRSDRLLVCEVSIASGVLCSCFKPYTPAAFAQYPRATVIYTYLCDVVAVSIA